MNFDPEWFIVYTDDEGFNVFSRIVRDIISADWEGENISVWNLRRNIFVGNVNEDIGRTGLIYNKNMIELSASSENAFKLYNFLNKGERKHIKVNSIKLKKNICVFI